MDMGKWGWMIISIGCIIIIYSQTNSDFETMLISFGCGLAFVAIGGIMSYMGYKKK